MMTRTVGSLVFAIIAGLCLASPAHAGWHEFWDRVCTDFLRNNCWPEPFRHMDRDATRAPFLAMIDNGWRVENTIVHSLFTESHQLTLAGQRKIYWIATQIPPDRRVVFVLQGETPEVTDQRVDSVQRYVASVVQADSLPPVVVTDRVPRGGSGDYLNQMNRKYRDSLPAPTLRQVVDP
jgi:hypothetical protein